MVMKEALKKNGAFKAQLEQVLKPIENSIGLPNEFYTDQELFAFERDEVIAKEWAAISFVSDLKTPGYVKPVNFMGLPLVIVRDNEDQIKVFHNVCSHRGMKLVHEEGQSPGVMICPYHAWTYNLDGDLKGTPHIGGTFQVSVQIISPGVVWADHDGDLKGTPHIGGVDKHTDERF